jgi:stage III sporulation protein AB
MAVQYTKRLSQLEQLRRMIFLLKGQIVYANASLPEAFEAVGKREKGPLGALFLAAAKQAETLEEANFSAVWEQEIEKLEEKNGREQSALSRSDRQSLAGLGRHLGFLDREMQERNLLLYLEELDEQIAQLRGHRQETCRLYTSLGVMGGIFLAVILI